MIRIPAWFIVAALFTPLGCAGCLGFGDGDPDGREAPNSVPPGRFANEADAGNDDAGTRWSDDASADEAPDFAETSGEDMPATAEDATTADTGTDAGAEVDIGTCGDGVQQAAESCDDGATVDCVNTHDGGDGACVPQGACSPGYLVDQGVCVPNTTGLTVPCANGSGFTLFRYHYSNNSTSAQIDVWDASCAYSFAPNSACNVYEICPGFCDPDVTADGYPIFDGSDYMRVRFNVNGLNFSRATLHVQARSYATSSSANFRVWSPLYGETFGGPVDNDFVYDWYSVDWTGYLYPNDEPGLTAIQLYGSNSRIAIKAAELCVE